MAQYHDLSELKKLSRDIKAQAKAEEEARRKAQPSRGSSTRRARPSAPP